LSPICPAQGSSGFALLDRPGWVDDLSYEVSWVGVGWRALLVVGLNVCSPQPAIRVVWYAARPTRLSQSADEAQLFGRHVTQALLSITERHHLRSAVAADHGNQILSNHDRKRAQWSSMSATLGRGRGRRNLSW